MLRYGRESGEDEVSSQEKKTVASQGAELPPDADLNQAEPMWQTILTHLRAAVVEGGRAVPVGEQSDARRLIPSIN
jgi:hypothetical protein